MGITDFLKSVAKAGTKNGQRNDGPGRARVQDFDRDQLENASQGMQRSESGLTSFLDNVGSFFRPAGTFATALADNIGGEDTTKNAMSSIMAASGRAKESRVGRAMNRAAEFLPPGMLNPMALVNAPTGDLANTDAAKAYRAVSTAYHGVDPDQVKDYVTPMYKQRLAAATEDSGFNDVARSIAENRQGQKQANLVESTLGRLPAVGAYFDRAMPSVEDKAVEAGATPEQAMFLSMLNLLEWVNAESKASAAGKLANAGKLRKAINRIGSPIVDPIGAAFDLGGDVPTSTSTKPLRQAKTLEEAFNDNLGLPNPQRGAVDDIADRLEEARVAQGQTSTGWSQWKRPVPTSVFDEASQVDAVVPSGVIPESKKMHGLAPAEPSLEPAVSAVARQVPVQAADPAMDALGLPGEAFAPPLPPGQGLVDDLAQAIPEPRPSDIPADVVDGIATPAPYQSLEDAYAAGIPTSSLDNLPLSAPPARLLPDPDSIPESKVPGIATPKMQNGAPLGQIEDLLARAPEGPPAPPAAGRGLVDDGTTPQPGAGRAPVELVGGVPSLGAAATETVRVVDPVAVNGLLKKFGKISDEFDVTAKSKSKTTAAKLEALQAKSAKVQEAVMAAIGDRRQAAAVIEAFAELKDRAAKMAKAKPGSYHAKTVLGKSDAKMHQLLAKVPPEMVNDLTPPGYKPQAPKDLAADAAQVAENARVQAQAEEIAASGEWPLKSSWDRKPIEEAVAFRAKTAQTLAENTADKPKWIASVEENLRNLDAYIAERAPREAKLAAAAPVVEEAAAAAARNGAEPGTVVDTLTTRQQADAVKAATGALSEISKMEAKAATIGRNIERMTSELSTQSGTKAAVTRGRIKREKALLEENAAGIAKAHAEVERLTGLSPTVATRVNDIQEALAKRKANRKFIQLNAGIVPDVEMVNAGMKYLKDKFQEIRKSWATPLAEGKATWSRYFSSHSLGKVDGTTRQALELKVEAQESYARALADAYANVLDGNIAAIVGSKFAGRHVLDETQKASVHRFLNGNVVDGVVVDEALLKSKGVHQDVIDAAKLVRREMDATSDGLMADTFNLPLEWFKSVNKDQRHIISRLAMTASKPLERIKYMKSVARDIATNPGGVQMDWIEEARKIVDDGFKELNQQGHWLNGEDPIAMTLEWAPYLDNRGKYNPLLYRLMEHGVLAKGGDATQLYIDTLRAKGVDVPADLEAFLYSDWMPGGAGGNRASELNRIRERNPNLSQDLKNLLQEIEDPAYVYAKGIYQVNRLRQTLTTRRWMANQEHFVSRRGETAVEFMARTGHKNGSFTSLNENVLGQGNASGARLGDLAGRLIHNDFWDLAFMLHQLPGLNHGQDRFTAFNREIMNRWKFWHTVANPGSHARQGMQNLTSLYLGGGVQAVANIGAAAKEYQGRGSLYSLARQHGLLGSKSLHDIAAKIDDSMWKHLDFNAAESFIARQGRFGEMMATFTEGFRVGGGKKAAGAWQYVDEIARMALFKTYIDRGWDIGKAADAVRTEVYSGVKRSRFDLMVTGTPPSSTFANSGSSQSLKRFGIDAANVVSQLAAVPFWGSTRFVLEQTIRNFAGMKPGTWTPLTDPGRMARTAGMVMLGQGLANVMAQQDGLLPDKEFDQRPDYLRSLLPGNFRLPNMIMQAIDDKGKVGYMDYSWMLPWGQTSSGGFNPKTGKMEWHGISSELVQMSPLVKPLVEIAANKDFFREMIGARSEVYNPLDRKLVKARKATAHLWRSYAPPWAVNPLGGMHDAIVYDGGEDGKRTIKEEFRVLMQGIANDSGHSASKMASGIYNSFDYWWEKEGPGIEKRLQVSDYMGREQYAMKAIADFVGIKITSQNADANKERRSSAQEKAISATRHYYTGQRTLTQNPAKLRELRELERRDILQIRNGKPTSWYSESVQNTLGNVQNALFPMLASQTKTPQ